MAYSAFRDLPYVLLKTLRPTFALPMPQHLEKIEIGAPDTIAAIALYLRGDGNSYSAASQPNLERCVAKDLGKTMEQLSTTAAVRALHQSVS